MNILFEYIYGLKRIKYSIYIDTTNGCNLKCKFCSRDNSKIKQMTTNEFETVLGKIYKVAGSLQLSCAWEYSIAKNAAEMIRTMGKYDIPSTTIYTNGNIVTDEIADALIDSQLTEFVVSFGEAKKETYEKLRRGGTFEKVVANIRKLSSLKKERRNSLPRICTNLTLVNSNIDELIEFVDLAYSLSVERIVGRHLILNKGLDIDSEVIRDTTRANSIIEAAETKARSYGIDFSVPQYEEMAADKGCRAPWQQLYISCNGDVSVCPRIHKYVTLGNLLEDSFSDIVKGKEMKRLRGQFRSGKFNNPVCPVCRAGLETVSPIDQGF